MPKKRKKHKPQHRPIETEASAVLASAGFDYAQAMASFPNPKAK